MSSDESMAEPLRPQAPIQDEHPGYLGDPYDIGRFVNVRTDAVDRETLLRMLTAPWTPDNTFMFPTGKDTGANRHFQRGYLLTYPWLAYSAIPEVEGGFCCTCVLFSRRFGGLGAQQLGTLVIRPFNKFKKATSILEEHQKRQYMLSKLSLTAQTATATVADVHTTLVSVNDSLER